MVDHRCRHKGCVNPKHLRLATGKQNNENQSGPYRGNKSGFRGVSIANPLPKDGRPWRAVVRHNGKAHNLGRYATPEEAGEVARRKRLELFTHNDADYSHEKELKVA